MTISLYMAMYLSTGIFAIALFGCVFEAGDLDPKNTEHVFTAILLVLIWPIVFALVLAYLSGQGLVYSINKLMKMCDSVRNRIG